MISLTADKYNSWLSDLNTVISNKKASYEELETLLGRLNHAASVLPLARYFLNRTRLLSCSSPGTPNSAYKKKHTIRLSKSVISDLCLFQETFLPKINQGININLLTYRRPSNIVFSDACPKGLGGYSVTSGAAWRWKIPESLLASVSSKNNLLEFLAAVITIWLELLHDSTHPLSCILALGDNTSAVGWLHKANVDDTQNKALHISSRKLATLLMDYQCCLYSQNFRGEFNIVADTLSRQHHLSDNELLTFILSHFPNQVPSTFRIVHLPHSITSWMTWLLQKSKEHTECKNNPGTKKQEPGSGGNSTSSASRTVMTLSSCTSNPLCVPEFSEPLEPLLDKASFPEKIRIAWREAQSKRPWQNWARSSGQMWGSTPTMAQTEAASTPY